MAVFLADMNIFPVGIFFLGVFLKIVYSYKEHDFNSNDIVYGSIGEIKSVENSIRHKRYVNNLIESYNTNTTLCADSSKDFPDILTEEELRSGAIAVVILVGIYCFTILAIICDKYFLPCVEVLCEVFNLSQDVAAATFMSVATSTPELFVNIIGTFVTESDIGIGTIVGSSLFNALGVAAIGSLAASKPIQLDWWPLTRDVIIYVCAISLLVVITFDGYVSWYEGLILFIVYFIYFTVMFNNDRISSFILKLKPKKNKVDVTEQSHIKRDTRTSRSSRRLSTASPYGSYIVDESINVQQNKCYDSTPHSEVKHNDVADEKEKSKDLEKADDQKLKEEDNKDDDSLFAFPKEKSFWKKFLWIYLWPIKAFLYIFIPNPRSHPNLYMITFIMCILFIGVNSYVVSWMITLIGSTFKIPDAVLGFTFLAAGGCLPESISITIMSRRGEGSMGVSNSLGANTMNILMSLGLPWFLKTISMGTNEKAVIKIESGSIEYTIMGLIGVALVLYITLYFNKFQLRRRVGFILSFIYLTCITAAITSELLTREHC